MDEFDKEFEQALKDGTVSNLASLHTELIQIKSLMIALADVYMTEDQQKEFRSSFIKRFTHFNGLRNTIPTQEDESNQSK